MYLLLIVFVVLAGGLFLLNRRNRFRAQYQETKLREGISFGTEVMTTSGLYGTVVGMNPDDTVQLSIAPGVQVKWAIAALRDVESLPPQYRRPLTGDDDDGDGGDGFDGPARPADGDS